MNASEVTGIVRDEIDGNWSVSNAHGVDLKRCLVPPVRREYADPIHDDETHSLWLVLEEMPEDHSGYQIVFDERTHQFWTRYGGRPARSRSVPWFLRYVFGNSRRHVITVDAEQPVAAEAAKLSGPWINSMPC